MATHAKLNELRNQIKREQMRLNRFRSLSVKLKSNLSNSDVKYEVESENEEEEEKKIDLVSLSTKLMAAVDSGSERDSDREHYDPDEEVWSTQIMPGEAEPFVRHED